MRTSAWGSFPGRGFELAQRASASGRLSAAAAPVNGFHRENNDAPLA